MRSVACILIALLLMPPTAAASCGPAETISEAVRSGHTSVFKARVLRVLPATAARPHPLPVRFSTIRAYKGAPPQIVTVYFTDASLVFHEGDVFLLSTYPFSIERPGAPREYFFGANGCSLRKLVRMAE